MKLSFFFSIFVLCVVSGCSKDKDGEVTPQDQATAIVRYLDGTGKAYTQLGGVYKQVTQAAPDAAKTLQQGDSLYINYTGYVFTSTLSEIYYTNIDTVAVAAGFDPMMMSFVPFGIKYGTTGLIEGLNTGLQGCKEQEQFMLYMPYDLAYREGAGIVPHHSAIALFVDVLRIKNN